MTYMTCRNFGYYKEGLALLKRINNGTRLAKCRAKRKKAEMGLKDEEKRVPIQVIQKDW